MAKFCTNCGAPLEPNAEKCLSCGKVLQVKVEEVTETTKTTEQTPQNDVNSKPNTNQNVNVASGQKSKIGAGLLAIFLGGLGVHNFYLGYTSKAVTQLLIYILGFPLCGIGPLASSIWGLVEGIMILTGSINKDAKGNSLVD